MTIAGMLCAKKGRAIKNRTTDGLQFEQCFFYGDKYSFQMVGKCGGLFADSPVLFACLEMFALIVAECAGEISRRLIL
jgi:hypothetical protein